MRKHWPRGVRHWSWGVIRELQGDLGDAGALVLGVHGQLGVDDELASVAVGIERRGNKVTTGEIHYQNMFML